MLPLQAPSPLMPVHLLTLHFAIAKSVGPLLPVHAFYGGSRCPSAALRNWSVLLSLKKWSERTAMLMALAALVPCVAFDLFFPSFVELGLCRKTGENLSGIHHTCLQ